MKRNRKTTPRFSDMQQSIDKIVKAVGKYQPIARSKPSRQLALKAIRTLIAYIGDNPDRPGLKKTPERVIKAWEDDWGIGYNSFYESNQRNSILNAQFDDGAEQYDQMICVRSIRFHSHCEHHLAEFSGTVDIAYIPSKKGKILGLSKLVRIVEIYSKRLQVQERLTAQIADFIDNNCKPLGVGVVIKAKHGCMLSRGVRQSETIAVTSALRGEMIKKQEVRDEFLRLVGR
jgi:GTP cyclohydrolase IA